MKLEKLKMPLLIVAIATISFLAYSFLTTPSEIRGLTKVSGYNHVGPGDVSCLALEPSCGYCPGEVHNKSCYVDLSKLSDEEKTYLGL